MIEVNYQIQVYLEELVNEVLIFSQIKHRRTQH